MIQYKISQNIDLHHTVQYGNKYQIKKVFDKSYLAPFYDVS